MKDYLNVNNGFDIKKCLEAGIGIYAANSNGAFFIYPNGRIEDNKGQVVREASEEFASIYEEFDGYTDPEYTLPVATASKLGGIKVGSGLNIASGGVLSAKPQFAKMENISELSDAPTAADFNNLISKLISAGLMEAAATE